MISIAIDDKDLELGYEATLNLDNFNTGLNKMEKNVKKSSDKVDSHSKKTQKGFNETGDSLEKIGKIAKRLILAEIFRRIALEVNKANEAFIEQERVLTGLSEVAKAYEQDTLRATQAAKSLAEDGLLSVTQAAEGLKFLLGTGFNVTEALGIAESFKDIGAFNNVVGDLGQAFIDSSKGIKTGSIELIENIGLTERLSNVLKRANVSMKDGIDLTNNAAQRQAVYNAILEQGNKFQGNANKLIETGAGVNARYEQALNRLYVQLGEKVNPQMNKLKELLTDVADGFAESLKKSDLERFKEQNKQLEFLVFRYEKLAQNLKMTKLEEEEFLKIKAELLKMYPEELKFLEDQTKALDEQGQSFKELAANQKIRQEFVGLTTKLIESEKTLADQRKEASFLRERRDKLEFELSEKQLTLTRRITDFLFEKRKVQINLDNDAIKATDSYIKSLEEEIKKTKESIEALKDKNKEIIEANKPIEEEKKAIQELDQEYKSFNATLKDVSEEFTLKPKLEVDEGFSFEKEFLTGLDEEPELELKPFNLIEQNKELNEILEENKEAREKLRKEEIEQANADFEAELENLIANYDKRLEVERAIAEQKYQDPYASIYGADQEIQTEAAKLKAQQDLELIIQKEGNEAKLKADEQYRTEYEKQQDAYYKKLNKDLKDQVKNEEKIQKMRDNVKQSALQTTETILLQAMELNRRELHDWAKQNAEKEGLQALIDLAYSATYWAVGNGAKATQFAFSAGEHAAAAALLGGTALVTKTGVTGSETETETETEDETTQFDTLEENRELVEQYGETTEEIEIKLDPVAAVETLMPGFKELEDRGYKLIARR